MKQSNLLFELSFRATESNKDEEIAVKLNWVWKRQFEGLKRKPVVNCLKKKELFVHTQSSFGSIQLTQRVPAMKLKPIAESSTMTAHEQIVHLNLTTRKLVCWLAQNVAVGETVVTVTQSQMAVAIGKTTRTVQTSLKACEAACLMISAKSKFRFTATRIEFKNAAFVDWIKQNHEQLHSGAKVPSPSIFTKSSEKFPFRWLKDPQRFATLDDDLKHALSTAQTYWRWIDAGCMTMGATLPINVVGQKRRTSDGERGGQLPIWGGSIANTKNAGYEMQKSAESAATWKCEATFNIPREVHPLLLVDDVSLENLKKLPDACAVIETSPDNFQATLIAPRQLTMQERKFAQFALIKLVDGDPGANSCNQLRRFPGSLNNKSGLDKAFVSRIHHLSASQTLSVDELNHLLGLGKTLAKISTEGASANGYIAAAPSEPSMSVGSTQAANELVTGKTNSSNSDQSASGQDFRFACDELKRGATSSSVISAIAIRAGQRRKNGKPLGDGAHVVYAQRTVRNATSRMVGGKGVRLVFRKDNTGADRR